MMNIPKVMLNLTHTNLIKIDNSKSAYLDMLKAKKSNGLDAVNMNKESI